MQRCRTSFKHKVKLGYSLKITCLLRERVEEVVEVELKADEKFVIELRFNDDTPNMQLSFTTSDAMRKWITSLTMILSTSIVRF
jgi:hypothetical protein